MSDNVFIKEDEQRFRGRWGWVLSLVVLGILINYIGGKLVLWLRMPFYFDSIGTILVAATGGALPGAVVGLLTNVTKMTIDSTAMYYSSINVLVAVCTGFFIRQGWLKKTMGFIPFVLTLSLIGGGFGGFLTWMLYGADSDLMSTGLIKWILNNASMNRFAALMFSSLVVDFFDKLISVLIVFFLYNLIPQTIRDKVIFESWKQRPLTKATQKKVNKTPCRKLSLRVKLLMILFLSTASLAITSTCISYTLYKNSMIRSSEEMGRSVAKIVSSMIDPELVDVYLEKGEEAPGYKKIKQEMEIIRREARDVKYIYVYRILEDGCHVVFDLDTEDVSGMKPGSVEPFDPSFQKYVPDLLAGKEIDPIISNDSYGWLLTVYVPLYNEAGQCVCYAATDYSMRELETQSRKFMAKMVSLFLGFFALIVCVGLWFVDFNVIFPINTMAFVANDFAFTNQKERQESIQKMEAMDICTGDEIEHLYHAVLKSSRDSMLQVDMISDYSHKIEKLQKCMILVLADIVESRDENTGQHVRKTAAYVRLIIDQLKKEGFFKEELTDDFADDVITSAPLHDIGKITIPDAILNKPGRLDDEEFRIMRSHSAAGRDIISNIIEMVPDSTFLREARNLAAHHHERWDGKGYPDGLSGENIPLSARIMAVADVFDALVSKRSYKEGFPFEKAMDIIREGVGTQFDPVVSQVFLKASDEVWAVMKSFEEEQSLSDDEDKKMGDKT